MTGNICKEPERKTSNSGKSVTSIDVAVKRPFTKDTTDFFTVVLWEKKCDYICTYGHKGSKVAVGGMLTTRKWQDKDGNNRTSFEIVADTVELMGGQQEAQPTAQPIAQPAFNQSAASVGYEVLDDGLPLPWEEVR